MSETAERAQTNRRRRVVAMILGGLLAAGAVGLLLVVLVISPSSEIKATESEDKPAVVENDRVILTEQAADRLGIETTAISDSEVQSAAGVTTLRKVVPYSAVLYDVDGGAFVYTSPEPLTFVRAPINVAYLTGYVAVLSDCPSFVTAPQTGGSVRTFVP